MIQPHNFIRKITYASRGSMRERESERERARARARARERERERAREKDRGVWEVERRESEIFTAKVPV